MKTELTGVKKLVKDVLNTPNSIVVEDVLKKKILKSFKEFFSLVEQYGDARGEYLAFPNEDSAQELEEAIEDIEAFLGKRQSELREDFYGKN